MRDIVFLGLSAALVVLAIASSYIASRCFRAPSFISRKICHSMLSLWVFIMVYGLESLWTRAIGPFLFIFLNILLPKTKAGAFLKKTDSPDIGLIAFPFSLLVLSVIYSLGEIRAESVIAAVLIMGFGDAGAGIIGTGRGNTSKSLAGSLAMFLISFILILIFTDLRLSAALIAAFAAAAIEYITPSGFDNLTVPLIMARVLEVVCPL